MKIAIRLFLFSCLFTFSQAGFAQDEKVNWTVEVESDGDDLTLVVKGKTIPGWHIYSTVQPDMLEGPLPTYFEFDNKTKFKLVGSISETKVETHKNSSGIEEAVFVVNPGIYQQKIKRKSNDAFEIPIFIGYQTCDDKMCIQAQANLVARIPAGENGADIIEANIDTVPVVDSSLTDKGPSHFWKVQAYVMEDGSYKLNVVPMDTNSYSVVYNNLQDLKLNGLGSGFVLSDSVTANTFEEVDAASGNVINYLEKGKPFSFYFSKESSADSIIKISLSYLAQLNSDSFQGYGDEVTINLNQVSKVAVAAEDQHSYWSIFFIAFLSGFAALLTPCVFPMIPMTVSFFTKQSKTKAIGIKNALIYGVSIIVIYVALGLVVTGVFGSDALNALSTNVWFNIAFFLLLVIFGISFLGAFEITLPSKWVNKVDRQADKGGLIGIFFMAFALALVSFSCTGPIIGTLLVEAADQGGMSPFFGMLGFSLALALPFGLFAAFPGWLNSLPQSGGWLNSVKVVLGLLEIALALKFLSKADLVTQSHLLEREMFLAIWIVLFTIIGLYLLGKVKFPHDSPLKHISIPRFGFAVVALVFVVYMLPGLWGAPLNILAGFPPPMSYSESPYGIGGNAPDHDGLPPGGHMDAHGILMFDDLKFAQDYGDKVNKPLMLDFTGYGCENCRKMEQTVWYHEDILHYLKDSVIVVSLHADDKTILPESEQKTMPDGYRIRSVGNKWSYYERVNYGEQSQPLYVLLDNADQACGIKASYETHGTVPVFKGWLNDNLKEWKDRKNALVYQDDGIEGN
jgi:cytochrome c biogenesis protein CcdA/thiol-disulfide isomerase/thioredoxin